MISQSNLPMKVSDELFERDNPTVVVVVDENDVPLDVMDKIAAHQDGGAQHRAFSIFLYDREGRLLLQKRAVSKYHFGGLWSNTCCGHAVPGEDIALTAVIRLWQEMGVCATIHEAATFRYKAKCTVSGLTENELDHIFIGSTEENPRPNSLEVDGFRWITSRELAGELIERPEAFTPWFSLALATIK